MPPVSAPVWTQWDGDTFAKKFHSREITVFQAARGKNPWGTTSRDDYPQPPLYWAHTPKPDQHALQSGPFESTTTYREAFQIRPASNSRPVRHPPPKQQFHPKFQQATESRMAFMQPPLAITRPVTVDVGFRPNPASLGTTTMRADYTFHKIPAKFVKPDPQALPSKKHKFPAVTTTRADYGIPKDYGKPYTKGERPEPFTSGDFVSDTTYRASYVPVPIPKRMSAGIGVQTASGPYKKGGVGGQFTLMIPQGAPAPVVAQKTFTTVMDKQEDASIVVVAKSAKAADGVVLGAFAMDGIKPAGAGIPKIEVTLKLMNERTLMASATYRNGQAAKAMTFKANRSGPGLRQVASENDVPEY